MRTLIIAIAALIVLLAAGLIWFAVSSMSPDTGDGPEGGFGDDIGSGTAVDSAARIEIEFLRQQVETLSEEIATLDSRIQTLEQRPAAAAPPPTFGGQPTNDAPENVGPNTIIDAYAQVVLIANRRKVNGKINVAGPRFLEQFLGRPRENLSDNCDPMTNPKLRAMLKTEQAGPIRVSMLQPALDSLRRVFANVESTDPDLYARINTAGSLCVRQIRGTRGRTSTHSFGLAVDLNIDGKLDTLGDGKTQLGLTILADFFRAEGWVWGAGFSREDSMHFEVSRQMLEQWRAEGKI
ncbi:M15 family metallopeptidase [Oceaniglobus trochenteri]|uniref:M15 family metallopeptidase n=1 Tax=Oceaniglobus trochenteri TaxID=2763260 RepID=UPI001CFF7CA5|nr:M15 family metallopeptidase [Oceaniglobus trochenteri]